MGWAAWATLGNLASEYIWAKTKNGAISITSQGNQYLYRYSNESFCIGQGELRHEPVLQLRDIGHPER